MTELNPILPGELRWLADNSGRPAARSKADRDFAKIWDAASVAFIRSALTIESLSKERDKLRGALRTYAIKREFRDKNGKPLGIKQCTLCMEFTGIHEKLQHKHDCLLNGTEP